MRSIFGSLGLVLLLVSVPVHTDSKRFELDDYSRVVRVSDPQFAPDGHSIVAVISRANLDEDRWDGELASIEIGSGVCVVIPEKSACGENAVGIPSADRIAFSSMCATIAPKTSSGAVLVYISSVLSPCLRSAMSTGIMIARPDSSHSGKGVSWYLMAGSEALIRSAVWWSQ